VVVDPVATHANGIYPKLVVVAAEYPGRCRAPGVIIHNAVDVPEPAMAVMGI
jgi:hypothetical protein